MSPTITICAALAVVICCPVAIALVVRQARRNAPPGEQPWRPFPEQQGPWGSRAMRGLPEDSTL